MRPKFKAPGMISFYYIPWMCATCMTSFVKFCVSEFHMRDELLFVWLSGFGVEDGAEKCTVFTNKDTIFKVDVRPFNIRASFGDGAVLLDSSGTPVLTDEWGVTLDSLHHGATYFLVCIFPYNMCFVY